MTVDKNLFYNQKHLQKILEGKQDHYMQNIKDPNNMDTFSLEVLKRKEWVRQNKERANNSNNCKNRVDMIGSGNMYDSSKIETMIARENFLKNKFSKNYSQPQKTPISENQDLSKKSKSNYSEQEKKSNYSRNSRNSGYRESMEGWPARNSSDIHSRRRSTGVVRDSLNAKQHNDQLFMKKSGPRKSLGYTNISRGKKYEL